MKSEQLEIAQLKREVAKLNAERAILKEGAVDSTDERNMIDIMSSRRIHNGADGSAWFVVTGEAGAMGAVESRPIVERHWSQSGQACRIDLRRVALKGRYRTSGKSPFATVVVCAQREEISCGLVAGLSLRKIAAQLGRAPSTISREVGRNNGPRKYRAANADERAWRSACRPKLCRLDINPSLQLLVAQKLNDNWSHQQISGWLKVEYVNEAPMRASHETICKSLFVQARGVLKKELISHLRTRRLMRRGKSSTTRGQPRGQIVDAISIRQRPAEVEDRAVPGHWEGDLLSGGKNSHIATLVERQSRFVMLVQVRGKDTDSVVNALVRQVKHLPTGLMSSLTWDRGTELADHKRFTVATDVTVYFCDPQSPWQRGSNENTNGLLRQYFPKGADLSGYSQEDLNAVALQLNTRPRKTLGFITPAAKLATIVASTA
jgi:IS30 family transposase